MAGPYRAAGGYDDPVVLSSSDEDEAPPKVLASRPSLTNGSRESGGKTSPRKSFGGKAKRPIHATATIIDLSFSDSADGSDVVPAPTNISRWKGKGKAEASRLSDPAVRRRIDSDSGDSSGPDEGISKDLESFSPPEAGSRSNAGQSKAVALLAEYKRMKTMSPTKEVKAEAMPMGEARPVVPAALASTSRLPARDPSPVKQVLSPSRSAPVRGQAEPQGPRAAVSYSPKPAAASGSRAPWKPPSPPRPAVVSRPTWATEATSRPTWAAAPAAGSSSSITRADPMGMDVDAAPPVRPAASAPQASSNPHSASRMPKIPFPPPAIPFPPVPSSFSRSPEKQPSNFLPLPPKPLPRLAFKDLPKPPPPTLPIVRNDPPAQTPAPLRTVAASNPTAGPAAPVASSSSAFNDPRPNATPSSSTRPIASSSSLPIASSSSPSAAPSTSAGPSRPAKNPSGPLLRLGGPSAKGVTSRESSSSFSSAAPRTKLKAKLVKKAAPRAEPEKATSSWTNMGKFETATRPPPPPEAEQFKEAPAPVRLKMRHAPHINAKVAEEPRRHSGTSIKPPSKTKAGPRTSLFAHGQTRLERSALPGKEKKKGKRSPSPGSASTESTPSREVKKRMKSKARGMSVVPEVSPQVVNGVGANGGRERGAQEAQRLAPRWRTGAGEKLGKGSQAASRLQQEEDENMRSTSQTPLPRRPFSKSSANGHARPPSLLESGEDLAFQIDGVLNGSDLDELMQSSENERLEEAVEDVRLGVDEVAIVAERDDSSESSEMDVDEPGPSVHRKRVVLSTDDEYMPSSASRPATARKHTRRPVAAITGSPSESDQSLSSMAIRPPAKPTRTAEQWRKAVIRGGQTDSDVSQALDDDGASGTSASGGRETGSAGVTDTRVYNLINLPPKPQYDAEPKTYRGHIANHQTLQDSPPPPDRVGTAIRVHSTATLDAWNRIKDKLTPHPDLHRVMFESYIEESTQNQPRPDGLRLLNDIDDETEPPDFEFQYSHDTIYNDSVPDPELSLGCGCEGPCDPRSKTCSCLKRQELYWYDTGITGFAYDQQGRIKLADCPIWECGETCGCPPECMNRVIQRGRAPETQIDLFKTEHKGWGVRARTDIAESTFIGIYSGELISEPESERRGHIYAEVKRTYLFDCDGYHISNPPKGLEKIDKRAARLAKNAQLRAKADGGELMYTAYSVDAFHYGFTRYFNHSCDPNLLIVQAYVKDFHPERSIHVIFTRRDVKAGDELCISYKGVPDDPVHEAPTVKRKSKWGTKSKKKAEKLSKDAQAAIERNGRCMCGTAACDGVMFT